MSQYDGFLPGDDVIFVNANNVAIFGRFVEYCTGPDWGRVKVEYTMGPSKFTACPHVERVGRVGAQISHRMEARATKV